MHFWFSAWFLCRLHVLVPSSVSLAAWLSMSQSNVHTSCIDAGRCVLTSSSPPTPTSSASPQGASVPIGTEPGIVRNTYRYVSVVHKVCLNLVHLMCVCGGGSTKFYYNSTNFETWRYLLRYSVRYLVVPSSCRASNKRVTCRSSLR